MNVFEVYRDNLCKNCKNKTSNLCEIRQLIDGTVKCIYYERNRKMINVLIVLITIILSPVILIAGFFSLAILWSILNFIVTSILSAITNIANSIKNFMDKKE